MRIGLIAQIVVGVVLIAVFVLAVLITPRLWSVSDEARGSGSPRPPRAKG